MTDEKKAEGMPAVGSSEIVQLGGRDISNIHNITSPNLAQAANLHESLAFYFLDKCDPGEPDFNVWFFRMVAGLTYAEVLRRDDVQNV